MKVAKRTTRPWLVRGLAVLAAGMAAVAVLAGPGQVQPAQAAPEDVVGRDLATWNLQGAFSDGGQFARWTNGVTPLSIGNSAQGLHAHDIVAIQESGSRPPGTLTSTHQIGGATVEEYFWPMTASNTFRYVTFMETDPHGHRVNMALATDRVPDEILVASGAASYGRSRAALGVRFDTTVYWSVHSLARIGGRDAPEVLTNIAAASGANSWIAMGDYNQDPQVLTGRMPVDQDGAAIGIVDGSGQATHLNGEEYDYMVTSPDLAGILTPDAMPNLGASDHWPVQFGSALAATASQFEMVAVEAPEVDAQLLVNPDQQRENGYYATLVDDDPTSGSGVWQSGNFNPSNDSAQLESGTGQGCIQILPDGSAPALPCNADSAEQFFTARDVDGPGGSQDVLLESVARPGYCLGYQYPQQKVLRGRTTMTPCNSGPYGFAYSIRSLGSADGGGGSRN